MLITILLISSIFKLEMCGIEAESCREYQPGGHKEISSVLADRINEPKCGGRGGGIARSQPMSTAVHMETNNFGELTPYLTYDTS
jgi:hypothetical protein